MFRVASSDGVSVAVHHLAGDGDRPPLLLSHATGFHAHCYQPIARALAGRFDCFGIDHRGHGETPAPPAWEVDWSRFGDDAHAVATSLAPDGGLVGVGHSMGGAALLMAAHRSPHLFARLVLFEPIAHDTSTVPVDPAVLESLPIVRGARRRRRRFGSYDEAFGNYEDKPPLSLMTPEVLRLYIDHGFAPLDDGAIELRCSPEIEADIFVGARTNGVWDLLPDIDVPTVVVAGAVEDQQPSQWAAGIADRLPRGEYVHLPHQTHVGPFSHPDELALLV